MPRRSSFLLDKTTSISPPSNPFLCTEILSRAEEEERIALQQPPAMRVESASSQRLLTTGSFTGFRPLAELGNGYLTATKEGRQPLCGNSEGWGPLSPIRYDFTPCFMDVWVSSVAVFGILFGAGAVWYLIKKKKAQEVAKNWHFWTKEV